MGDPRRPGPPTGLVVVELASDHGAFAGKLLADMGARVIVVEPPGGAGARQHGQVRTGGGTASLFWEHYATSKESVVADLDRAEGQELVDRLIGVADIVLEGEPPGRLEGLGLGPQRCGAAHPSLIWTSVTTYGHADPRSGEPFSDLTVLAEGGAVWSCGYDDHRLAPVRGSGNQGFQLGCLFAAMATLVAMAERSVSGQGQHVDVSLVAAVGVSTEMASYSWLVAGECVARQTGRHAMTYPTMPTQAPSADGGWVQTGLGLRGPAAYASVAAWLDDLGLRDRFPDSVLVDLGASGDAITADRIGVDPVATEILRAGREALVFIASQVSGNDFFVGAQERGIQAGVVLTPAEVMVDRHLVARGWPQEVADSPLGDVRYPGPWYRSETAPWSVRPAPTPGEHHMAVTHWLESVAQQRRGPSGPAHPEEHA